MYKKYNVKVMKEFVFVIFIIVLLSIPFLGMFNNSESTFFEKRKKVSFNNVLKKGIFRKDIFLDFENFFNDNFYLRRSIIKAHSKINRRYFNASAVDKVMIGKDGWLFYKDKALECYKNINILSDHKLNEYKNKIEALYLKLLKNKIKFYLMVIPNKNTVYSEYMPENIKKEYNFSRLEQITNVMSSQYFINNTDFIMQQKGDRQLYYKNDTHWNKLGAFYGFLNFYNSFIVRDYNKKKLNISDFFVEEENCLKNGDLDGMLGDDKKKNIMDYKVKYSDNIYTKKDIKNNKHFITENKNGENLKILVYRDSFFSGLYPYFSETFSYVEYIWDHDIDLKYVLDNKYDIVIIECVERFIMDIEVKEIDK